MHFFDRRIEKASEDFKALCVESLNSTGFTQQDIADACGTTQATVSRYFSYNGDHQLPAFLMQFIPPEIALPLLIDIADKHNFDVTRKPGVEGKLNGKIEDELLDMLTELGEVTKEAKSTRQEDFRRVARHLPHIKEIVARMEAEVKTICENKNA